MNQPSKSASSHSISTSNSYAASHPSLNENDADNRTSARTSVPTPPPASTRSGGMYTFYWICPCSQCHTCTPRPQATRPLNRRYFDEFEDRVQLETERGLESIGTYHLAVPPAVCRWRVQFANESRCERLAPVPHDVCGAPGVYESRGEGRARREEGVELCAC
ncbi:hypothetical protein CC86DRAFT_373076 [Ophiobolus disseminans]|uniref:Uncharacterized protein n=1 Tax=Ophiobolus disseminans TaxID=1469910 RepID=A0A6A6ZNF2_9PLEO|nr:hypothetical protein CC86DRAFT_373076 [Ophiobolus disseminans]